MAQQPPQPGWVRISSTDPPVKLVVRLSDQRPNVTAGYGGWTEVARPRRRPLSIFQGSPGLRMDLPVLLDEFKTDSSVERQIAQLERIATPHAGDGSPSRIRVQASGAHVPHQDRTWVIDSLAWGDALMNQRGNRTRQQVTLSLLEYIADVRVADQSAASKKRAQAAALKTKAGAAQKRVVVNRGKAKTSGHSRSGPQEPAGEDLLSIAARELGDADRWVEIAQLNGIRDPRTTVIGQVIRLP